MYDEGWSRFMETGQIEDYLAYKQEVREQFLDCKTRDETGEAGKLGYAGFCDGDRYRNQIRADR